MSVKQITFLAVLFFSFTACERLEEPSLLNDKVVEGVSVQVTIPFKTQVNNIITRAEQSADMEQRINNAYLFIFDRAGNKIAGEFCTIGNGMTPTTTNYSSGTLVINAESRNEARIVGIANLNEGNVTTAYDITPDMLDAITTYDELCTLQMELNERSVQRGSTFVMTGFAKNTSGEEWIQIPGSENSTETLGCTLIFERTDAKTRAVEVEEIGYVAPVFDETQTRGEISQKYTDRRRETKKYKVFSRTNVLRHSVVQEVNGQKYYNTSFAIQVHVSGQKKKTLIGWNTYNDRFYIENLHWDLTIAGKRISFETYRNNYSKTESTKNLYATIGFGNGQFNMTPTEVPMPSGFNCIVHRARSREMGNCGALTDINCCMQLIQLPVSECI